jgi:Skp family chaperone for outer membrane proteins
MKAWHVALAAVLVTLAWFGSHVPRTTGEPPRAGPRTRIALVNMTYVMKYSHKFTTYQNEMKKLLEPFQEKDKSLRAKAEKAAREMAVPGTPANDREKLSEEVKKIQQAMQENNREARAVLSKRSDEQMTTLYTDVANAAARYARAHDFELVLHYNEGVSIAERHDPTNIGRKLQNGALTPLYAVSGLDVSKAIVEELNKAPGGAEDEPVEKRGR